MYLRLGHLQYRAGMQQQWSGDSRYTTRQIKTHQNFLREYIWPPLSVFTQSASQTDKSRTRSFNVRYSVRRCVSFPFFTHFSPRCQVSATDGSVSASPSRPAASPSPAGQREGNFFRFVRTEDEANMVRSVRLTSVCQGEHGGGVLWAVRRKTVWRFLV